MQKKNSRALSLWVTGQRQAAGTVTKRAEHWEKVLAMNLIWQQVYARQTEQSQSEDESKVQSRERQRSILRRKSSIRAKKGDKVITGSKCGKFQIKSGCRFQSRLEEGVQNWVLEASKSGDRIMWQLLRTSHLVSLSS